MTRKDAPDLILRHGLTPQRTWITLSGFCAGHNAVKSIVAMNYRMFNRITPVNLKGLVVPKESGTAFQAGYCITQPGGFFIVFIRDSLVE